MAENWWSNLYFLSDFVFVTLLDLSGSYLLYRTLSCCDAVTELLHTTLDLDFVNVDYGKYVGCKL